MTQTNKNITDAAFAIAEELGGIGVQLKYLGNGNAATTMGAIEGRAMKSFEGAEAVALSLNGVGDNLYEISKSIDKLADSIADGLTELADAIRDAGKKEG